MFFGPFCFPAAVYSVSPALASNSSVIEARALEIAILEGTQNLSRQNMAPDRLMAGHHSSKTSADQAETVLRYILVCESGGRDVSELDSNHKMSRGPAQFQDATWAERQDQSGIEGAPTNAIAAVDMSLWSLEHGYIAQWSCAAILRIIPA